MFKLITLFSVFFNFLAFADVRESLTSAQKEEVVNVLKANEKLHASFFKYDAKSVADSAQELKNAMNKVSHEKIKKLLKFSMTKLDEIKANKTKDENRQNYHTISMALIYILNTYDVGSEYNAYSCPMVKKKWVQNSSKQEKVHNPYAANMPHCGSKDTSF